MSNEPRNTAFEELKRTNPNVKALATVWRGSDEYAAWMETYIKQDKNIIEYVENEQVTTFYRLLTDKEVNVKDNPPEPEPKPIDTGNFEILSVPHEHDGEQNQYHKQTHVKLGHPRWFPVGERFAWVEYVLVDQYRQDVPAPDESTFVYAVTSIHITDEQNNDYSEEGAAPVYTVPTWLEPWEALWAIGEVAVVER